MKQLSFYIASLAIAVALVGCNESGSKPAKGGNNATVSEADCPIIPVDSSATGEFDPIAGKDARACGTITLWGSAMPKSFNMWEDYNSFSAGIWLLIKRMLLQRASKLISIQFGRAILFKSGGFCKSFMMP